jgi:hypothetical protein
VLVYLFIIFLCLILLAGRKEQSFSKTRVEDSEQILSKIKASVFLDHAFVLIIFIYIYACMHYMTGLIYLSFVIHILEAGFLSLLLGRMLSCCTLVIGDLVMMNNTETTVYCSMDHLTCLMSMIIKLWSDYLG